MGAWQGVAMDSLKFHPETATRGDLPAGRAACGRLLPLSTPHAVRACLWSACLPMVIRLSLESTFETRRRLSIKDEGFNLQRRRLQTLGQFHNQADAGWIVICFMPCGR
jgi:hypothetical protein